MQKFWLNALPIVKAFFSYDWGGKEIIKRTEAMMVTYKESSWGTD